MATFNDFMKLDIRVGTIVKAEIFKEAKRPAYKLEIDFGDEIGIKKSSAQITEVYKPEELEGKQILAVVNFPEKQIANFLSQVLVLGTYSKQGVVLIQPTEKVENGDKLVLGVSGGPDSIAMLNILNDLRIEKDIELDFNIVVAHINHMIRDEAIEDENFVKKFCEEKGIEFYSKSIDVKKLANTNKISTEEAGRNARYDFFDEILDYTNSNKIAIAHNKNDKAETIIMNFMRGSGITGLKGIEPKRKKYIRPLIECERTEIENYCKEKNLDPRIDKTNFENEYTRNKIRNVLIPYIKKEFNPNIINTLNRLSELVGEEEEYIEKQVERNFEDLKLAESKEEIVLDLKKFNKLEKVIKSRLVLYTIMSIFGTTKGIEKVHVDDIIKLCDNNIGNKYLTPNKNIKVLVKDHKIYFLDQR